MNNKKCVKTYEIPNFPNFKLMINYNFNEKILYSLIKEVLVNNKRIKSFSFKFRSTFEDIFFLRDENRILYKFQILDNKIISIDNNNTFKNIYNRRNVFFDLNTDFKNLLVFNKVNRNKFINYYNEKLNQRCPGYYIEIDYLFNFCGNFTSALFKNHIVKRKNNDFSFIDFSSIIIFLKNRDEYIASIEFEKSGSFLKNNFQEGIRINTRTLDTYQGRQINKLLRFLGCVFTHQVLGYKYLFSSSDNPISAYTLIKHFYAEDEKQNLNSYLEHKKNNFTLKNITNYYNHFRKNNPSFIPHVFINLDMHFEKIIKKEDSFLNIKC